MQNTVLIIFFEILMDSSICCSKLSMHFCALITEVEMSFLKDTDITTDSHRACILDLLLVTVWMILFLYGLEQWCPFPKSELEYWLRKPPPKKIMSKKHCHLYIVLTFISLSRYPKSTKVHNISRELDFFLFYCNTSQFLGTHRCDWPPVKNK